MCKVFDCFLLISTSFIYLLTLLFEEVYIVKPLRSRISNSERYFVGMFMKKCTSQTPEPTHVWLTMMTDTANLTS